MNNRGFVKTLLIIVLLILVILLYFYTDQTKDLVGMLSSSWEPIDIDPENKTVTLQFANASEVAHKVLLDAEEISNESFSELNEEFGEEKVEIDVEIDVEIEEENDSFEYEDLLNLSRL